MLSDSFPGNFTAVTYTATQSGGALGFTSSGSGNINDVVTMPSHSKITYRAKGTIGPSTTGTLSNTAMVNPPNGVTDSDLTNNSATDNDTLGAKADLRVRLTDGRTTVSPGANDTYTLVVINFGPSDVTGAVVKNDCPASFTGVTYTATQSSGALGFTSSGSGNINDVVTMPSGSKIVYEVHGVISPSASGSISDTATVTAPSGVIDPIFENNSATDTNTL